MYKRQFNQLTFNKVFCVHSKTDEFIEDDWRKAFSKYGEIYSVHIARNKQTKKPTGFTYIEFAKTSQACLAMEEMDNQSIKPGTRTIRVHLAHRKEDNLEIDVSEDNMCERICIKHPRGMTEDTIKEHFSQFGLVTRTKIVLDRKSREPLGIAFVKYAKQSDAAKALEECDSKFRPRWADVRATEVGHGGPEMFGPGGMPFGDPYGEMLGMGGYGDDPYGFTSRLTDAALRLDAMEGRMSGVGAGSRDMLARDPIARELLGRDPIGRDVLGGGGFSGDTFAQGTGNGFAAEAEDTGPRVLEAMVPPDLGREQVERLFDIAQGLMSCEINMESGLARVEYKTGSQAAHAKEKIDGMVLMGSAFAIRFAKNQVLSLEDKAARLEEQLQQVTAEGNVNPEKINQIMRSLQQVTQELKDPKRGKSGGGDMGEMQNVPWCNVPLPPLQPMLNKYSPQLAKVFLVCTPDPVPDEMIRNLFSRFGNLNVNCGFNPGKRFGFANFGNKESAERAVNHLNGAKLCWQGQYFDLKVEMSTKEDGDRGEESRKRPRQS